MLHEGRTDLQKKHVKVHKQEICNSQEQLDKAMSNVLDIKGEGLMLKDPNSLYVLKRSDRL